MNYKLIYDAVMEYEKMTPLEIQEQIKPIIKSYKRKVLADKLGISESALCLYCKNPFVKDGRKPGFVTYIKIMSIGINETPIVKETLKEYRHRYYIEVTKKKRAEKRAKTKKNV